MNFANITIPPLNGQSRTYHLWKLPHKTNWTGLIACHDFSFDAQPPIRNLLVSFTFTSSSDPSSSSSSSSSQSPYPPPFDNQVVEVVLWNEIPSALCSSLPASGGNGSESWWFLVSRMPSFDPAEDQVEIRIGMFIIEMQTLGENETSHPLSFSRGQSFLYRVHSFISFFLFFFFFSFQLHSFSSHSLFKLIKMMIVIIYQTSIFCLYNHMT